MDVSCSDLHEAVLVGETLDRFRVHLERCEPCRELAADEGRLGRALGPRSAGELASEVGASLRHAIAAERGLAAWLRSRSSPARLALAVAPVAAGALIVVAAIPRVDLAVHPPARMALALTALGGVLLTAVWLSLRPLHAPALGRAHAGALLALAFVAPWALAALPEAHAAHPAASAVADAFWRRAGSCLALGIALAGPFAVWLKAVDRGGHAGRLRWLLAIAAAGLAGNLLLQLHCPITQPAHLLAGHAPIALAVLGLYGVCRARRAAM